MPYPSEHSARLRNPADFEPKTFRRTQGGIIFGRIKVPKTIGIVWGKLKGKAKPSDFPVPQALRFDKKSWTVAEAKAWLKDNGIKYLRFEPAAKEEERPTMVESLKAELRGDKWEVTILKSGMSLNGVYYPPDRLEEFVPRFEGAQVNVFEWQGRPRHLTVAQDEEEEMLGGYVSNMVGVLKDVRVEEGELVGTMHLVDDGFRRKLKNLYKLGTMPELSISVLGEIEEVEVDGRKVEAVVAIEQAQVDVVEKGAAGGRFRRMVASMEGSRMERLFRKMRELGLLGDDAETDGLVPVFEGVEMDKLLGADERPLRRMLAEALVLALNGKTDEAKRCVEEFVKEMEKPEKPEKPEEKPAETATESKSAETATATATAREGVSDAMLARLGEMLLRQRLQEAKLPEDVSKRLFARYKEEFIRKGGSERLEEDIQIMKRVVESAPKVEVIKESKEKQQDMMDDFFEGKVHSFRRVWESVTGTDTREIGPGRRRILEAATTSDFSVMLANTLHRQMLKAYKRGDHRWRDICSEISIVSDFREHERIRVGGFSKLDKVKEKGTYTEKSAPTDEAAKIKVTKYGNLYSITEEILKNDDVAYIRGIPRAMANAALHRLRYELFYTYMEANPTCDWDSTALFHSDHSNKGTGALSVANVKTAIIAMNKQTELDSSEVLGLEPRYILVPPDLRFTARAIFDEKPLETVTDEAKRVLAGRCEVISVKEFTDANNWYLVADPADCPTYSVLFLDSEEPYVVVSDDERTGSRFTADKITYKCRLTFGIDVVDYRGLYGGIVA